MTFRIEDGSVDVDQVMRDVRERIAEKKRAGLLTDAEVREIAEHPLHPGLEPHDLVESPEAYVERGVGDELDDLGLREVAAQLKPPRALFVPFQMGFPLGEPNNAELQHEVIAAALRLLERNDLPVLDSFTNNSE